MCPCTQKATSPPNQKLCHKTAKEATKEADTIDIAELVESLLGPKALEYPELGYTLAVAEVDESCAAGWGSSDTLNEAEVDKWFAELSSSAFHTTLDSEMQLGFE